MESTVFIKCKNYHHRANEREEKGSEIKKNIIISTYYRHQLHLVVMFALFFTFSLCRRK